MTTQNVSDHRSNSPEQLEFAAKAIGRSENRLKVFEAIYHGKHSGKSVAEIASFTRLTQKQVLEAAKKLADNKVVHQERSKGVTIYKKDDFYKVNKTKILAFVKNPKKLEQLATKRRPLGTPKVEVLAVPSQYIDAKMLTIADLDQFRKLKPATTDYARTMLEKDFKEGMQEIIGEKGSFHDWGGETADLWTTQVLYKGVRIAAAFAFKGRGQREPLTPGRMGKNGDQIQRLFRNPADIFVIQFWGKVESSVMEQLEIFAKIHSIEKGKRVYYCLIDGTDSNRIIESFPAAFPSVFGAVKP